MDIEDLDPNARFLYIVLTQCAIKVMRMNLTKEFFVNFCSETWESALLSDIDELEKVLTGYQMKEVKDYVNRR